MEIVQSLLVDKVYIFRLLLKYINLLFKPQRGTRESVPGSNLGTVFYLFIYLFLRPFLTATGWPRISHIAQAGLEFMVVLLPYHPKCWNERHEPPCSLYLLSYFDWGCVLEEVGEVSGTQIQGFVHTKQAFLPISYNPSPLLS